MGTPAERVAAEQEALRRFEKAMQGESESSMENHPLDGIYRIAIPELPNSKEDLDSAVDRLFEILNNTRR